MKKTILLTAMVALLAPLAAKADHIWINEFHYDNIGADTGEFIEIGLRTPNMSGFTFTDYSVAFYNGNTPGAAVTYGTTTSLTDFAVSGPFSIDGSTAVIRLYTLTLPTNGIQNGGNDGFALFNATNGFVEALYSYEGVFTASNGPAAGLTSTNLAVSESDTTTAIGSSLSATGTGTGANQFNAGSFAVTTTGTPGAINSGQTFAVPEPTTATLLLGGIGILTLLRRRRR